MLRYFLLPDKNHRNIPAVAILQGKIGIYIHFAEDGAEFQEQRRNGGLGFVAKMASRTSV